MVFIASNISGLAKYKTCSSNFHLACRPIMRLVSWPEDSMFDFRKQQQQQ
jgi:hypothetical protein